MSEYSDDQDQGCTASWPDSEHQVKYIDNNNNNNNSNDGI